MTTWKDDSLVIAVPMVFRWCEMDFVHPQYGCDLLSSLNVQKKEKKIIIIKTTPVVSPLKPLYARQATPEQKLGEEWLEL